jgi:hypothetical protein
MQQGTTDRRARVRLYARLTTNAAARIFLGASLFTIAALVAACSGGGAGVPNPQTTSQVNPQAGNCFGNPGPQVAMQPLPVGKCSPPPQPTPWDIIVANPGNNTATSYQFSSNGNVAPVATMSSTANKLNGDYGIWFDGDTGDFFIANVTTNTVNRYNVSCLNSSGQSGCPDQQLSGGMTGLNAPYAATENYGLMLPQNDEPAYTLDKTTPSIVAQLENQSGNATPLYSISGPKTGLNDGQGLAVDGNTSSVSINSGAIYADSYSGAKVMMWQPSSWSPTPSPGQALNVSPNKTISGTNTGITHPMGLYVDQGGYLYVVNRNPDKILVFDQSATGNATPKNTISASLSNPYGVAVYTDFTVYVTNDGGTGSVTSYTHGETGPSTLVHNINGAKTGLNNPANLDLRIYR